MYSQDPIYLSKRSASWYQGITTGIKKDQKKEIPITGAMGIKKGNFALSNKNFF